METGRQHRGHRGPAGGKHTKVVVKRDVHLAQKDVSIGLPKEYKACSVEYAWREVGSKGVANEVCAVQGGEGQQIARMAPSWLF
jgi:hypothetical protein